ncbi:MAG: TonB-dependent receptor, partial [Pseudomonadota bacterium]
VGGSVFAEEGAQSVPLGYDLRVVQALLFGSQIGFPLFSAPPGVAQIPPTLDALLQTTVQGIPIGYFEENFTNFNDSTSWDLFGDMTYALTDRLDVTAGVRYTYDDKQSGYSADAPNGPSALTGAGVFLGANVFNGGNPVFVEDTFDGLTYRLALNYDLSDTSTVFANYGKGRRPEVLSYAANVAQPNILEENFVTIDAEETDAFELGYRGEAFDGRLRVDTVAYYYMYENFQTTILNEAGTPVPVNGGNASGFGFEGSAQWRLNDYVLAFGNYAYNGVEFDDEDGEGNPQVRAGNRFRLAPAHTITIGGLIDRDFDFGRLSFSPILAWKDDIFFDDDNDRTDLQGGDFFVDEFQEDYALLDLRLTFEPAALEGLIVELFMENAFDREYLLDAGNTGDAFGIPTFIAGPPQTYGIYISQTF